MYIISAIEKPKNNLFQTICVRNLKYRPVFILHIFVIHGVLRCESISTSDFVQRNTFSKIKTKKVVNQNKIDFHSWASLRAMVNLIRLVPLSDILKNVFFIYFKHFVVYILNWVFNKNQKFNLIRVQKKKLYLFLNQNFNICIKITFCPLK